MVFTTNGVLFTAPLTDNVSHVVVLPHDESVREKIIPIITRFFSY